MRGRTLTRTCEEPHIGHEKEGRLFALLQANSAMRWPCVTGKGG
jgi:hypothetical protein